MIGIKIKDFYTTGEVARELSVSIPTVRRWCNDGTLNYFVTPGGKKRGGHKRISRESVRGLWQTYYIRGNNNDKNTKK